MAIDIKKMKAKLAALQNKGGSKTSFFRPEEGTQYNIRIVPTPDGDPFKETWFHYEIGKTSIPCPKKNNNEECPICAFASKLFKEDTEDSRKMAKKFLPRQRFFSPVVVRGEEKDGVKVWGYGKNVYQELIELCLNPDYGDITDPDTGYDITIKAQKQNGQAFPTTKLTPRNKASKLCSGTGEECNELLSTVPNFDELHEYKSPEEISRTLDEYLAADNDSEAESVSSETVKYAGKQQAKSTEAIDSAFAELMSG